MIKEALDKRAQDELRQLNIYVKPAKKGKGPTAIVRKIEKKETPGQIAAKTVSRAAVGGAMAGGLPFAFLGIKPSGEITRLKGKPTTVADVMMSKDEKLLKGLHTRQKLMRGLALGGALAGAGSALYKPIRDKLKESAMRIGTQVSMGKFKAKEPGGFKPPGKSLGKTAVDPTKSIKEVLEKQAALESAQL